MRPVHSPHILGTDYLIASKLPLTVPVRFATAL